MEEKIVKRQVWNAELCIYEGREIPTGRYNFTEEDKMSIVSEYLTSGRPAQDIMKKYHLSSRQILFNWIDKYVNERGILSLPPKEEEMSNQTPEERIKELESENQRLTKALELEKLRAEAYNTMIDVAEKTFNIPVRKKSGTQQ